MSKNAIVIGGSKGVGLEISSKLVAEGWNVIIVSSNQENLNKANEIFKSINLTVKTELADATNKESIEKLFCKLKDWKLDLCVNCVGKNLSQKLIKVKEEGELIKHSLEDWNSTININLNSTFICGREEAYTMIKQKSKGVIVNISTALSDGAYGQSAYVASKAAINSLTKTWALELAKYNIRCVAIAPGAIEGETLFKACAKSESHKVYMNKLREQIPLKRFITESEVAETVCFVAKNKYVTGTVIRLDGGGIPSKVNF